MPLIKFKTPKRRKRRRRLRQHNHSTSVADEEIHSRQLSPTAESEVASSPSSPDTPTDQSAMSASLLDRDLLCRANMKALIDLMTSMGFVEHFMSDAGGHISMTSVKLYISRLQHFMMYCRCNIRSTDSLNYNVTDADSFLDLWELILRRLNALLPTYTRELTTREELAPDTVRNILNQFKAIIKWYLLFASEWRDHRLDIHTTNMLFTQSTELCRQLTRQYNKAAGRRRTASGKDLIEFKVSISHKLY